jgi:type VI secretion system secreted protein VgrG
MSQLLQEGRPSTFTSPLGKDVLALARFDATEGVSELFEFRIEVLSASDHILYRIVLRPWLWLLSRTSDCRIWHDKTAIEIIEEVFRDRGFSDFKAVTTKSYCKIEYCVQYRETDLNFVCRLM